MRAADAWHDAAEAVAVPRVQGTTAALSAAERAYAQSPSAVREAALEDALEAWIDACPGAFARREEKEARQEERRATQATEAAEREERRVAKEKHAVEGAAVREEQRCLQHRAADDAWHARETGQRQRGEK